jgi:hypothetical protein
LSQLVSDDNPRGYNEKQKQRIADADTLVKKRSVELKVMRQRLQCEMNLKEPVDDEYGMDSINAMIAEINAEYAASAGINLDASVVGIKDHEDEKEESDSHSHESRPSKRYVNFS